MSDAVAAALVAAGASGVGSVLTFVVGIRSVRRSVTSSNGALGTLIGGRLDRLEGRLDRLEASLGEVRERLAFQHGAAHIPLWTPPAPT